MSYLKVFWDFLFTRKKDMYFRTYFTIFESKNNYGFSIYGRTTSN